MTGPYTHVGTKLEISSQLPNADTLAAYQMLTYIQIKGVRVIGNIGRIDQVVDAGIMNKPGKRLKVGREGQSIPVEIYHTDDAGQMLLRGAIDSPMSYSYRITSPNGRIRYFQAFPSSVVDGGIEPQSIADQTVTLELDSKILEA